VVSVVTKNVFQKVDEIIQLARFNWFWKFKKLSKI